MNSLLSALFIFCVVNCGTTLEVLFLTKHRVNLLANHPPQDLPWWLYSLFSFKLLLGNNYHFDILIQIHRNHTLNDRTEVFWVMTYYETKSSKIIQARYKKKFSVFPNKSQIFKLVKKFEDRTVRVLPQSSLRRFKWSLRRDVHMSSMIFHAAFKSAFNWKANIWSMWSRAPLDIFSSCLRLNASRF